jgi:hypothetical protein
MDGAIPHYERRSFRNEADPPARGAGARGCANPFLATEPRASKSGSQGRAHDGHSTIEESPLLAKDARSAPDERRLHARDARSRRDDLHSTARVGRDARSRVKKLERPTNASLDQADPACGRGGPMNDRPTTATHRATVAHRGTTVRADAVAPCESLRSFGDDRVTVVNDRTKTPGGRGRVTPDHPAVAAVGAKVASEVEKAAAQRAKLRVDGAFSWPHRAELSDDLWAVTEARAKLGAHSRASTCELRAFAAGRATFRAGGPKVDGEPLAVGEERATLRAHFRQVSGDGRSLAGNARSFAGGHRPLLGQPRSLAAGTLLAAGPAASH